MSKSGQKLLETGSIHGMVAGACALPLTARCVRPQNDLQAQARAHRLGQLKTVMIFRCAAAGHARGALQTRGAHRLWFAPALLQGTHVRSGASHQRFWVHWFRCCHRPAPSATSVAAADGQPGESRPPASHAMRPARLVTHNTVEERMLAVSRRKLVLERVVVQTNDASLRQARRPPPPPPCHPACTCPTCGAGARRRLPRSALSAVRGALARCQPGRNACGSPAQLCMLDCAHRGAPVAAQGQLDDLLRHGAAELFAEERADKAAAAGAPAPPEGGPARGGMRTRSARQEWLLVGVSASAVLRALARMACPWELACRAGATRDKLGARARMPSARRSGRGVGARRVARAHPAASDLSVRT